MKDTSTFSAERKIVQRELKRFGEFAKSANNRYQAIQTIWELARIYNLMGVLGDSL